MKDWHPDKAKDDAKYKKQTHTQLTQFLSHKRVKEYWLGSGDSRDF